MQVTPNTMINSDNGVMNCEGLPLMCPSAPGDKILASFEGSLN